MNLCITFTIKALYEAKYMAQKRDNVQTGNVTLIITIGGIEVGRRKIKGFVTTNFNKYHPAGHSNPLTHHVNLSFPDNISGPVKITALHSEQTVFAYDVEMEPGRK